VGAQDEFRNMYGWG